MGEVGVKVRMAWMRPRPDRSCYNCEKSSPISERLCSTDEKSLDVIQTRLLSVWVVWSSLLSKNYIVL